MAADPLGAHQCAVRALHPAHPSELESQLCPGRHGPVRLPPGKPSAPRGECGAVLLRGSPLAGRGGLRWITEGASPAGHPGRRRGDGDRVRDSPAPGRAGQLDYRAGGPTLRALRPPGGVGLLMEC